MIDVGEALSWLLKLSALFAILGAINWGLVVWFDLNLVTAAVGEGTLLAKTVYSLVGLGGISAAWQLLME